jgi:hypothetical protein
MQIKFDPVVTLLNPTNYICTVNNNTNLCTLTVVNGILYAKVSVTSTILFYSIFINNIRNPNSTEYFKMQFNMTDLSFTTYYSFTSPNYQVTVPYPLTVSVMSSNCTNF